MDTPESYSTAQRSQVETLFGHTARACGRVEKIIELDVTSSKAALAEAADHTTAVLGARVAQELLARQASLFQPLAEKTAAYNRHLYNIASATSGEFSKTFEETPAELQKSFSSLVDSTAKNAPAGSETAVAVMKSAVSAATNAFESMQKAVKQASDMTEANINAVASTATQAATATSRKR